jgi:type IV pilus assembly protein PilW
MRPASSFRLAAGFSIVELMVAMVIALVATIVIFQTFAVSEGIKRTSTSGGDAQQNGALALYAISRELRMAGYGINNAALLGCTVRAYDTQHSPPDIKDDDGNDYTLAPAIIEPAGADTEPDEVTVNYGSSDLLSNPAKLMQNMADPTSLYRVNNRYGYTPGDVVIAAEAGNCSLAQITATPDDAGKTDEVHHNTGTYVNAQGVNSAVRFNKAGGLGATYTTDASLYNLGSLPTRNRYRVENNQLVLDSTFGPTKSAVVADNIVQFRVEYGKDDGVDNGTVNGAVYAADDGMVDNYSNTMPAAPTAQDWRRVIAIRMAVVARSALAEKPAVAGGACDTTTAAPTWSGGTLDVSADPNWNCYRYRVFETTIPLRNLIWQQL